MARASAKRKLSAEEMAAVRPAVGKSSVPLARQPYEPPKVIVYPVGTPRKIIPAYMGNQ
jgi:hypothetical protein